MPFDYYHNNSKIGKRIRAADLRLLSAEMEISNIGEQTERLITTYNMMIIYKKNSKRSARL